MCAKRMLWYPGVAEAQATVAQLQVTFKSTNQVILYLPLAIGAVFVS